MAAHINVTVMVVVTHHTSQPSSQHTYATVRGVALGSLLFFVIFEEIGVNGSRKSVMILHIGLIFINK